jgi:uncharacterized protein (DUF885 family)
LGVAARAAATADLGAFLQRELMPLARRWMPAGLRSTTGASRYFLGAAVDLREAYAWSARLRAEMTRVGNLVRPGATVEEVMAILDEDPARRVAGREYFRGLMQGYAERAIAELNGKHFDIPQPDHRIEAVIPPTNDGWIFRSRLPRFTRPARMPAALSSG